MNHLKLTSDKLSVEDLTNLVTSPSCGAISVFIGTTRDNFENKVVERLEYEAYEDMGVKCLENICKDIRHKWDTVENIAIYHRLGEVPIKEASIIIAISSPHRDEAMKATEFCINEVKKSLPVWKKEVYTDSEPQWKENKELVPLGKRKRRKIDIEQKVKAPFVPPHLIQIRASKEELNSRIDRFMLRKRNEIDINNIREFCQGDRNSEFSCARIDAVVQKRKDSKSHLRVDRVLNSYQNRDQKNSNYMTKFIPPNGIEERLCNVECQLSLSLPTPKNIYRRIKEIEDRLLHLEAISPEYIQFWDKSVPGKTMKKRVFSIDEIDQLIAEAEKSIKAS